MSSRASYTAFTRWNNASFSRISSSCLDNSGAIALAIASISSLFMEDFIAENTLLTRSSITPLRSSASIVFSNVGADALDGDGLHFRVVPLHRLLKGRPVMFQLDLVERRNLERRGPGNVEWIGGIGRGSHKC